MRTFFLCVLLIATACMRAQDLRFSHLDQKQGLSQNTATAFLQDKDGFIWVGTQDGLNRYDGYTFNVYRRLNNDTNTLSDNFVLGLAEDKAGNIWVGTRNGLSVYSKVTNRFYRCYLNPEDRTAFHNNIRNMFAMNNGDVVIRGNSSQVYTAHFELNAGAGYFTSSLIAQRSANIAYCSALDQIAIVGRQSISFYSPDGKSSGDSIVWRAASRGVPSVIFEKNYVIINDSLDVLKFNLDRPAEAVHLFHSGMQIVCMRLENEEKLWIGTIDGVSIVGLSPERMLVTILIDENKADYFSLQGSRVESIYRSAEGLMWIGTVGGVNVYDPLQTRFTTVRFISPNVSAQLPVWFVMSFGKTTLWSDDAGLKYECRSARDMRWVDQLPADIVYTAGSFDSNGKLWLGTRSRGIIVIDTAAATVDRRLMSDPVLQRSVVMEMIPDGHGEMWIASINSLCTVDETSLDVNVITQLTNKKRGLVTTYFTSLCINDKEEIYVGSALGIYQFSLRDTSYIPFKNDPADPKSLSYNIVNNVKWLDNKLWVATMGYGLDIYDPASAEFTHYTTANGLANNTIYGIERSSDGFTWLSSNEGLIMFNDVTGNSRNFTMRDGLPTNEFVINKHASNLSTGKMYFGSSSGLVEFNPLDFPGPPATARPVISRLQVNYKERAFSADTILVLSPDERNLTFEFTAIDFRNQDKISYAYQLEGFDTTWHPVSSSGRMAVFTNLPYGDYKFRLRYRVSGEDWSPNVLEYSFFIATPFYATWWFRIILVVTGIVITALVVRYISQRKLRAQLEELKLQEKIRNEKERISRDLHDNVGAQLTYVISSLDNLSYTLHKNPETSKESDKLEQLGEFARGTMDQLRESIWAINSEHISLSELGARWKQYLAQLTESRPEFTGTVSHSGVDNILKPSVAIDIHRIVQEAITNAFKHSGANSVEVSIYSEGPLTIRIKDRGKGFNGEEKSGHYGIRNMKERAELIGASLEINGSESGTEVRLYFKDDTAFPDI